MRQRFRKVTGYPSRRSVITTVNILSADSSRPETRVFVFLFRSLQELFEQRRDVQNFLLETRCLYVCVYFGYWNYHCPLFKINLFIITFINTFFGSKRGDRPFFPILYPYETSNSLRVEVIAQNKVLFTLC